MQVTKLNVSMRISWTYSIRVMGGALPDVAMNIIRASNARELCIDQNDRNFKKLKFFLKNLFVRVKPTNRRKKIQNIEPFAGNYRFSSDNGEITVEVHVV